MRKPVKRRARYGRRFGTRMAAVIMARVSEGAGPVPMPEIRTALDREGYNGNGKHMQRTLARLVDQGILERIDGGRFYQALPPAPVSPGEGGTDRRTVTDMTTPH